MSNIATSILQKYRYFDTVSQQPSLIPLLLEKAPPPRLITLLVHINGTNKLWRDFNTRTDAMGLRWGTADRQSKRLSPLSLEFDPR